MVCGKSSVIYLAPNMDRTAMFLCGIAPREVQMCSVFTERGGSPLLVELGMGLFLLSGWIFHNIIIPLTIYTCGLVME